ncbi:MAG: aminomethyl transferase family protein [Nitrospirae bacterium]|nr:aminomethyl transferase family protein [Nitrospirota bacterium]
MRILPLSDLHQALGASFTPDGGWEVPAHYGDSLQEYRTVCESAGLFDLSHRGKIVIRGRDRVKFLQGLLTQDIPKIAVGGGAYAAMVTLKGKMSGDMRVFVGTEEILLDLEGGQDQPLFETLNKYATLSHVTLENVTEAFGLLSIQGPKSGKILEGWAGGPLNLELEFQHEERELPVAGGQTGSSRLKIIRFSRTGEGTGYDLLIPREDLAAVWQTLLAKGEARGLKPAGMAALETFRIEAGVPRFGHDMNEETFPLEANLLNAISFEKGCYLGQEPVARMHFRGHPNRNLMGILCEGEALSHPGDKIHFEGKEIGWITSAVYSPKLQRTIALGYIRREHQQAGERVLISGGGSETAAHLTTLPFTR